MEKARVPKGEKYWYIIIDNGTFYIDWLSDYRDEINGFHFMLGNYFYTQEEAEYYIRKIQAVLKGADVIEMPSEEESEKEYNSRELLGKLVWDNCYQWLKSKIVK